MDPTKPLIRRVEVNQRELIYKVYIQILHIP